MPSFKSKIFNFMMRNRHFSQGKLKKEVFDFNTSIDDFRERYEKGASKYAKIPNAIEIREENSNGIKSEWIIPEGANKSNVILYVHGGYHLVPVMTIENLSLNLPKIAIS